ncbi:MAG: NAD(P)H-dependent oxidoreductase, partial [Oscillospiraceae bacterium]|nr:NAD(P)H-dependent oxidoreductase [Oscillospiraceae bacterium]
MAGEYMPRNTLIINGSPRVNGDTAALICELRRHLNGEVAELSAYRAKLAPCVDCRSCWVQKGCVVEDDMRVIYGDAFDNVVLASPVYYSTLPGPVL